MNKLKSQISFDKYLFKMKPIILLAKDTLKDKNHVRFSVDNVSNKKIIYLCFKTFYDDNIKYIDFDDVMYNSKNNEIVEQQYYEEINTLIQIIENMIEDETSEMNGVLVDFKKMYKEHTNGELARNLWDFYSIPWRFYNNSVYLIIRHSIFNVKIIKYNNQDFIDELIRAINKNMNNERERLNNIYISAFIILGTFLILFLYILF